MVVATSGPRDPGERVVVLRLFLRRRLANERSRAAVSGVGKSSGLVARSEASPPSDAETSCTPWTGGMYCTSAVIRAALTGS